MGQTFKQKFASLDPVRRARIVAGMDQMHRRHKATKGGAATLPYDPSEYLADEETILAYIDEVRRTADPFLLMEARIDAARARQRLSQADAKGAPGNH